MNDEITNAEVVRRLEAFIRDVRLDLAEISRRLDQYVMREVYAAEQKATDSRLNAIETRMRDSDDQRRADRRWLIAGVIVPLISLLAMIFIAAAAQM